MTTMVTALQEGTKAVQQSSRPDSSQTAKESFSDILQEHLKEDKKEAPISKKGAESNGESARKDPALSFSSEKETRFSALERLLYDLVYRDPSTWSYADRAGYHVDEKNLKLPGFASRLPGENEKFENFMAKLLNSQISPDSRRSGTYDNALLSRLAAQQAGSHQGKRTPFGDLKTSLQEIAKKEGVSENQIFRQLVEKLALRQLQQGTEVEGTLKPSLFGEISFRILVKNNRVTVTFSTGNEAVAKLFEDNLGDLRTALLKHELAVNLPAVEINAMCNFSPNTTTVIPAKAGIQQFPC